MSATGSGAAGSVLRRAGSLPFPDRPAGTVNAEMPFDHIIVVMMENHSFDNLFGDLGRTRTDADALHFDGSGAATNSNPGGAGSPGSRDRVPVRQHGPDKGGDAELGSDP